MTGPGGATSIADHALLSDLRTAALIDRCGTFDWWCVPRFDSAACFAALLDTPAAGGWRLAPTGRAGSGGSGRRARPTRGGGGRRFSGRCGCSRPSSTPRRAASWPWGTLDAGPTSLVLLGGTLLMTATLAAGLAMRERRWIGFEGVSIPLIYVGTIALVVWA